jgi:hypothetical protein
MEKARLFQVTCFFKVSIAHFVSTVPQLEPKTEEDKRLYHEAEQRKQLRAKTKEMKKIYEKAFSPESTPITYNVSLSSQLH